MNRWRWIVLGPFILGVFAVLYFAVVFFQWENQQDKVLKKLVDYKTQLDIMRSPINAGEASSSVDIGGVAIPSRVYDRNGILIGEYYSERRELINLEKIPEWIPKTLIANEDRSFYQHHGLDYAAIVRAFFANIITFGYSQGGSTITQQLSKVLFTTQEKTIQRKIFEVFCSRAIENNYTKKEILEMYLNLIYFGHGNYGVESASRFYFNKSAAELDVGESAMMIGIIPSPNRYSPINNLKMAMERQELAMGSLVETGAITEKNKKSAIDLFKRNWGVKDVKGSYVSKIGDFPDMEYRNNPAPYFMDYIQQKLLKKFSNEEILKGGLRIYTTLDLKKQKAAASVMNLTIENQKKYYDSLIKYAAKKGNKNQMAELTLAKEKTNGALVSIEPGTGYILAMVGGFEFTSKNQFNRAVLAKRQIGSVMKPLVYYTAISQKQVSPATILDDTKLTIGKKTYDNYDYQYLGKITARRALQMSRNIPAIRVLQMAGIDELRTVISDSLDAPYSEIKERVPYELGVAIGTPVFTPMEIAQIYSTITNQGKRIAPRDILRIENAQGKILWEEDASIASVPVLDPVASYITVSMLQGVFESDGSAGWVEPLRKKDPNYLPYEVAGKTGTTSDWKDAWFVGIVSDEVTAIWLGNDMNTTLGRGRTGGSLCAPAWVNYIRAARRNDPPAPFLENWTLEDVTRENFCEDSGGVPRDETSCDKIIQNQVFFAGTEPRTYAPSREVPGEDLKLE